MRWILIWSLVMVHSFNSVFLISPFVQVSESTITSTRENSISVVEGDVPGDEAVPEVDFKYKVTTMQGDIIEFSEAWVKDQRLYIHMNFTLNPTAKKPVAIYSLFTKDQYYRFENALLQVEYLKLTGQKLDKKYMVYPPLKNSTIAQPGQAMKLSLAFVFPDSPQKMTQMEFVEAWSADPNVSAIKVNDIQN